MRGWSLNQAQWFDNLDVCEVVLSREIYFATYISLDMTASQRIAREPNDRSRPLNDERKVRQGRVGAEFRGAVGRSMQTTDLEGLRL